MKMIRMNQVIAEKRRKKGVTQEEMAAYLGVSKAAVSKWESGQNYPDVALLPVIAAYFSISVDELLGYEEQMAQEEIKKLYHKLSQAFAEQPFARVHEECRSYIKKYFSCWRLLFAMGTLLVNHAPLAGPERSDEIYQEAAGLFQRVEAESGQSILARQALSMRAFCYLALRQPAETISLLAEIEELPISTDILLAKAHAMRGESQKAIGLLQRSVYLNICGIVGAGPDLLTLYADTPEKLETWLDKTLEFGRVFNLADLNPSLYFPVYLIAAQLFISHGKKERTLDMLEAYTDAALRKDLFPLTLKTDGVFDALGELFADLPLGAGAPRSDRLVRKDLIAVVKNNPVFADLASEPRYGRILARLASLEAEK
ncbi:helix-turn-helix domain-containing protein [Sporolactobacillus putidus]|uniref:Transcriptional regulator n=1 Tax=Sporolactobacillus putidus TaxID=492735 RepID=A0A917S7I7_9BACL|nr:helix-turn-helix transcriptional regulator [Sporolactobacillus putidus]GGL60875.1 transcriptional regulator [Sporolactobacillus putidus]